jgi:hypothetical protein
MEAGVGNRRTRVLQVAMNGARTTSTLLLLIGIGLLLSACVESVASSAPVSAYADPVYVAPVSGYVDPAYDSAVYGYAYPAYGSLNFGWDGWHHGWDHGHWDGYGEVGHEAHGEWGHGFAGHASFAGHGGIGGHGGGGGHDGGGHR